MVKDHYAKLGFTVMETTETGASRAVLDLASFTARCNFYSRCGGLRGAERSRYL